MMQNSLYDFANLNAEELPKKKSSRSLPALREHSRFFVNKTILPNMKSSSSHEEIQPFDGVYPER